MLVAVLKGTSQVVHGRKNADNTKAPGVALVRSSTDTSMTGISKRLITVIKH